MVYEYKSCTIRTKKDYVEVSRNGTFCLNADNVKEAKKEIDLLEEEPKKNDL